MFLVTLLRKFVVLLYLSLEVKEQSGLLNIKKKCPISDLQETRLLVV